MTSVPARTPPRESCAFKRDLDGHQGPSTGRTLTLIAFSAETFASHPIRSRPRGVDDEDQLDGLVQVASGLGDVEGEDAALQDHRAVDLCLPEPPDATPARSQACGIAGANVRHGIATPWKLLDGLRIPRIDSGGAVTMQTLWAGSHARLEEAQSQNEHGERRPITTSWIQLIVK